ncbi:response regulator [Gynuella sunshinyii]|uniref:histidine kinase n=1 Tax=Gynuella sunshinyii YC6258 TaxID=1445510 RepID=A0A0C5VMD2_9GAMM|nr:hybrid sensor histidine kinase/response regulator [Gynuella sunshinyii]AJQ95877.1 response regulator consisting of a CheY-like receiver domain and a winged-helix DNA-binding domain [Gynuella sunshinyii YC6258]
MGLLFNPVSKVQKDRKILKKIDKELAVKSLPSMLSYFVVFLLVDFAMGFKLETRMISYVIGMTILVIAILRIFYGLRFDGIYAKGPHRWRTHFMALSLLNAVIWGGIQIFILSNAQFFQSETLMLLYSSAITAGTITLYSCYIRYVRAFVCLVLIPPAVFLFFRANILDSILAVGMLVYLIFLLRQAQKLYTSFWDRVEFSQQLQQQVALLNASRIEQVQRADVNENVLHTLMGLIKTPLQGVLGMLSLVKQSRLDNDQRQALELATQSGDALVALMTDLEDYSKIQSGNFQLDFQYFDLRKFTENLAESLGHQAHELGLELSYLYDINVPSRVNLDKKHVGQVIQSQIQLALNFASDNEVVFKVSMEDSKKLGSVLKFSVYFESIELDIEELRRSSTGLLLEGSENIDSTALSLMISTRLAQIMGGDLACNEIENAVYSVVSYVPLEASSQQIAQFQSSKELEQKTLWLVAMPPRAAKGLAGETSAWGMQVEQLPTFDALSERLSENPDFILLNLPLNEHDETLLAFLEQLYQHKSENTLLILYGAVKSKNALIDRLGRVPYLTKPAGRYSLHDAFLQLNEEKQEGIVEGDIEDNAHKLILLAEDDLVSRTVTESMLKKLGYQVVSVENGREVVNETQKQKYDLVLMDCLMPVLDGYGAARMVRTMENNQSRVPILALTVRNSEEEKRECLTAGMDDFISKPITLEELASALKRWIG